MRKRGSGRRGLLVATLYVVLVISMGWYSNILEDMAVGNFKAGYSVKEDEKEYVQRRISAIYTSRIRETIIT